MIVDFHTHIFKTDLIENREIYLDDKNYSLLYSNDKARMIDYKNLLESMSNSGIDYAVAMGFPWEKEKYCEEQNLYFRSVWELSKGRIIPFGSIPLNYKINIDEWVKRIKDIGLFGIGEVAFYSEGINKRNANKLREILESAHEYSLPLCLHVNEPVGHTYTGKYDPDLKTLYSILADFKETTIILAHWGGGLLFYELMPEVGDVFQNIYYDTAASPYLYRDTIYDIAIKIVGSESILFGSDYPLINFNRYLTAIEDNVRNKKNREKIIGENALRILKPILLEKAERRESLHNSDF